MVEREVTARLRERGLHPRWRGRAPSDFRSFAVDSRRVSPGALFCAIRGVRSDGHAFLRDAMDRGAAAAVVECASEPEDLPELVVTDTRRAASHLASLFAGDPGRELRLVAVTGTNGKTTTAWVVRHLLAPLGPAAALGTLGLVNPRGDIEPGALTTPGPVELMELLARGRDLGARFLAMEVSSHALDQHRPDALEFAAAAFTNVSRDHLDYHADMAAYRAAKLRLAELVAADGVCVVNADEPAWTGAGFAGRRVVTFGFSAGADVRAEAAELHPRGTRFRLCAPRGAVTVDLPLLGEFNVSNALAAAAVALELGAPLRTVGERLADVPQVPGRLERIREQPSPVVRDYAHTPDALERVLKAVRPMVEDRLIVVFGCGGDRDRGKRPLMGEAAVRLADRVIVTSDNPRSEDPSAIIAEITASLPAERFEAEPDRRRAIARALQLARPADLVLLAGKGHEAVQIVGDEELPFDEAEVVAELTAEGGGA